MNQVPCPICLSRYGALCKLKGRRRWDDSKSYECAACGHFEIDRSALAVWFGQNSSKLSDMQRAALSHYVINSTNSIDRAIINTDWMEEFISSPRARLPNPAQQAVNLIKLMGDHFSEKGEGYVIDKVGNYALIGALNPDMLSHVRNELESKGLIQKIEDIWDEEGYAYSLTLEGWERYKSENSKSSDAPSDVTISEALSSFDTEGVHRAWEKALQRRHEDAEGAITASRTLLETVCKHILDNAGQTYSNDDLPKLYSKTATVLNLAPSQHTELTFKAILGGCHTVVQNLGTLRNKIGDAHGQGRNPVRPTPRHAALAVNLAGSMATFLIETWNAEN